MLGNNLDSERAHNSFPKENIKPYAVPNTAGSDKKVACRYEHFKKDIKPPFRENGSETIKSLGWTR